MQDEVEFAIVGAGAIGSIIGAHLARSGCRVVMLARGSRAQQIRQHGLRITGLAEFSQPVTVVTEPANLRAAQVLILATKTRDSAAALAPLRGASIDIAFSIQNGLMKDDLLAGCFGRERVLGALADTSGELMPSGEVMFSRNANIFVGELDGSQSARAQRIAGIIDAAGVRATSVADIQRLEWSKFAAWVGMMILSVTTRASTWKYFSDPGSALVLVRLMREVSLLAHAHGIELSDQAVLPVAALCRNSEQEAVAAVQRYGALLHSTAPQHRMSSLQDLEAGRALEVEETLGWAVRAAEKYRVALPLLNSFFPLVAAIDRVREKPDSPGSLPTAREQ
jgi:2-dehydropantoate 2-reductase